MQTEINISAFTEPIESIVAKHYLEAILILRDRHNHNAIVNLIGSGPGISACQQIVEQLKHLFTEHEYTLQMTDLNGTEIKEIIDSKLSKINIKFKVLQFNEDTQSPFKYVVQYLQKIVKQDRNEIIKELQQAKADQKLLKKQNRYTQRQNKRNQYEQLINIQDPYFKQDVLNDFHLLKSLQINPDQQTNNNNSNHVQIQPQQQNKQQYKETKEQTEDVPKEVKQFKDQDYVRVKCRDKGQQEYRDKVKSTRGGRQCYGQQREQNDDIITHVYNQKSNDDDIPEDVRRQREYEQLLSRGVVRRRGGQTQGQ